MSDGLHNNIGCKIKERRCALGMTREGLAAKTTPPMSSKYLWEIETGRKKLSADILRRLAITLEVTANWLLDLPVDDVCVDG